MPRVKQAKVAVPPPTIREVVPDVWVAGSRSRLNVFHTVHVHREYPTIGYVCSCEYFRLGRGKVCAHIALVREAVEHTS